MPAFRYATKRMTHDEALEVLALRKAGMSVTDICIAMEHFHGCRLSCHQVTHLCKTKAGVKRGKRPPHADRDNYRSLIA